MSKKADPRIEVPRKLFRVLVGLQAHYGMLLNGYDGGDRRAVKIPQRLKKHLSETELRLRSHIGEIE